MFFNVLLHFILLLFKNVSPLLPKNIYPLPLPNSGLLLCTTYSHITFGVSMTHEFSSFKLFSFQVLSLPLTRFYFPPLEIFQSALSKCNCISCAEWLSTYTYVNGEDRGRVLMNHHQSSLSVSLLFYFLGLGSWYVDSFYCVSFLVCSFYSHTIIVT